MPAAPPTLIAVAHGTRDAAGISVLESLADAVRKAAPDVSVALCYVDVAQPSLADILAGLDGPAVLVPVLLSTGYHVKTDIPGLVAGRRDVVVTDPIGPDQRVSAAALRRFHDALSGTSFAPSELIVVSAGSSDPEAREQLAAVSEHIAAVTDRPVHIAQLTETDLFLDAPATAGVVCYLLAPGHFATKLAELAAPRVTGKPIGADPMVVEVILERYRAGAELLHSERQT